MSISVYLKSLVLAPLSLFDEKKLKPYWNNQSKILQPMLWLPHTKVSKENEINYTIDESSHWKKVLKPNKPIEKKLSIFLPKSSIPSSKKAQQRDGVLAIASKKIRFYPNEENKYHQALTLYRRAYNLAIEQYKNGTYRAEDSGKWRDLRLEIKKVCKEEQENKDEIYNSLIVDNAVQLAKKTFKTIIKRNKKLKRNGGGDYSILNFKSRKRAVHSFAMDRMPKGLNPANKALGTITLTENIPNEAIGKQCIITYNKGRWFIQVQQHIQTSTETQGSIESVAIDPGVRTFATCYSTKEVIISGDDFSKDVLFPLMKKVDKLLSYRKKLENTNQTDKQWYQDRLKFLNRKIDKLKCKKDDLLLDLHNRLAFELVNRYDVIFLPTFETKKMSNKQKRNIRRVTTREMLNLNHYQFKQRIKWYADKYGKHVVDCNESYTSKTLSWNGEIDSKLGGKKVISDGNISVNRDINGARGIFLKQISKVA